MANNIAHQLRDACERLTLSNDSGQKPARDGCRAVDCCLALVKLMCSLTSYAMPREGSCHRTVAHHIGALYGRTGSYWAFPAVPVFKKASSSPTVTCAAPVPLTECVGSETAFTYAALDPVIEFVARTGTCDAPAPATKSVASVSEHVAPARCGAPTVRANMAETDTLFLPGVSVVHKNNFPDQRTLL